MPTWMYAHVSSGLSEHISLQEQPWRAGNQLPTSPLSSPPFPSTWLCSRLLYKFEQECIYFEGSDLVCWHE